MRRKDVVGSLVKVVFSCVSLIPFPWAILLYFSLVFRGRYIQVCVFAPVFFSLSFHSLSSSSSLLLSRFLDVGFQLSLIPIEIIIQLLFLCCSISSFAFDMSHELLFSL